MPNVSLLGFETPRNYESFLKFGRLPTFEVFDCYLIVRPRLLVGLRRGRKTPRQAPRQHSASLELSPKGLN